MKSLIMQSLRWSGFALAAFGLFALTLSPVNADDRELFRSQNKSPYLFVLLDTSGSMNWALTESNDHTYYTSDFDQNVLPGDADDPGSRGYQAKSGIYSVIKQLPASARVGFAHFAQPNARVYRKNWLYTPNYCDEPDSISGCVNKPPWYNTVPFPQAGKANRFGDSQPGTSTYWESQHLGYPPDGWDYPDTVYWKNGTGGYGSTSAVSSSAPNQFRLNRLAHFPKLEQDGKTDTNMYFTYGGSTYRLEMDALSSGTQLGDDTITVRMRLWTSSSSSGPWHNVHFRPSYTEDEDGLPFEGANDILTVSYDTLGMGSQYNYYQDNPCGIGWEDNGSGYASPTSSNPSWGINYTTWPDPHSRTKWFDRGDVLPWDWKNHPDSSATNFGFALSGRDEFLKRLAPNTVVSGEFDTFGPNPPDGFEEGDPIPDFRIARYYKDARAATASYLELKSPYVHTPPFAFFNGTPVGDMVEDFKNWFDNWEPTANPDTNPNGDPDYKCRERFVILLTDGEANCTDPIPPIAAVRGRGIRTFVVGFGPGVDAGQLKDMATAGGTGEGSFFLEGDMTQDCERWTYTIQHPDGSEEVRNLCPGPILADSRKGLTDALLNIVEATEAAPTSFASAAVPSAQVEAQESIFLTSFLPVDGVSTWPGTVNHFLRPLPLALDNNGNYFPDTSVLCGTGKTASCFAWNAGNSMLGRASETGPMNDAERQAPLISELTTSTPEYRIDWANATNRRRVLYSQENINNRFPMWWDSADSNRPKLDLFLPPVNDSSAILSAEELDFYNAAGIDTSDPYAARLEAELFVKSTLAIKKAKDPRQENATDITWIMGDVFHSDPVVVGQPSRFDYMQSSLGDNGTDCYDSSDNVDWTATNYRCFFEQHRLRRKVLLLGANDGMLHAFDAGKFAYKMTDGEIDGEFGWGTGQEIWAYIPRVMMGKLKNQADPGATHDFMFDGTPRVDDVFIDMKHQNDNWNIDHRKWRTVAISGLREGGKAYIGLDVTQPDRLRMQTEGTRKVPIPNVGPKANPDKVVPTCTTDRSGCYAAQRYPAALWEFEDLDNLGLPEDLDGNGAPDLGYTWSIPNTGRIRVELGGTEIDKFVAIVGGGIDPAMPGSGNFLYMIDIETGKAIYKRQLDGPTPSEPAAVDTNNDGLLDTIYIGTVQGSMYKVDLSATVPTLNWDTTRPGRYWIDDALWDPFKIFDTGGKAIYYPASVVYVALQNRYAISFGTGDREDIFDENGTTGRFYTMLDEGWTASTVPSNGFDETYLASVHKDDTTNLLGAELTNPSSSIPGYYIVLSPDERMITKTFTIAGITVFSTFEPSKSANAGLCSSNGTSNIYTVFTTSGNPLTDDRERYRSIEGFVSNPFTENSATKDTDDTSQAHGDELDDDLQSILQTLQGEMPKNCRFSNVTINIKTVRSDTGVEFIAPLPVCQVGKNWKQW